MVGFKKEEMQMTSVAHDRCCGTGKMREGRHDFVARVENEIIVIKDVPTQYRILL